MEFSASCEVWGRREGGCGFVRELDLFGGVT